MKQIDTYILNLQGPILILGASGFIGANLFKMVSAVRKDVYAVVRRSKNWRLHDISESQLLAVDLTDRVACQNLVHSVAPQTVFNCVAYGAYSFEEDATLIYQTNFQAVVNVVESLRVGSIAAFIHAGSSSEYGTNSLAPEEDSLCEPNSAYAVSKLATANYLSYVGSKLGFPCVNLRLYSVYGPLEDTSRLIPNLLKHAIKGNLPPLVQPQTSRDFIHVADVCAAFILAAVKMNADLYGQSFNVGTGKKTTIAELAELARVVFNVAEQPRFGTMDGRAWDLINWYSNPRKALEQLGWQSQISLEDGLRLTEPWVRQLNDRDMRDLTKKSPLQRRRSVSAVVACYKDAQAIPIMHKRLTDTFNKIGIAYEIIFVNDGSPDDTAEVILEISKKDPHVVGILHSRNFGSQMAFRSGMEMATKDSVVLLDGDLQDPPELIESFYAEWERGSDVVYGRRVKRDMPWHWGLMYKLFYRLFRLFSYVDIPLDAGDFSLMDRRVVNWLLNCPERDLFVRGLRAYVGFKQVGVDYQRPDRMFGRSTNNLLKNIEWAKRGIFSFSNVPLTMLTSAGLILLGISVLTAVIVGFLRVFIPDVAPKGLTTLLIVTLMFGSLNIFAIGLVGEYVAKIMSEVKQRPKFIRSAFIRNGKSTRLSSDVKITL
jgi:nucleoside-diphosphate-sugar epimerase/glycosyltransferase involved in cell wall biosynthesis